QLSSVPQVCIPRGSEGQLLLTFPASADRTLLVRHLPAELTAGEKEDLLKYFKAQLVHDLSDKGQLKHTAFALTRLHQLKLLGHTLVFEFAKEQDQVHSPYDKEKKEFGYLTVENGITPNHGLTFLNSCLKYMYPPPSSTILANRVNALASVPKFYVQVLHLMNKMNLPTAFRSITARPPIYEDHMPLHPPLPPTSPQPPEEPPWPEDDEELSSEELEDDSSDDEDQKRMNKLMELANLQSQRPKTIRQRHVRKKRKIKDMLNILSRPSQNSLHLVLLPSDVFDQPQPVGNKRIEFHISTDMPAAFKKDLEKKQNSDASSIGFGKIFPKSNLNITEEIKKDSDEMPSECISRRELEKDRISREEMETLSVFRSYEPGEPNCRIYVKNLAKHVQEKDLKYIFGRYIMFDIRLMKEGRMKGQASIGLSNEKAAAKALKEANGYVLFGKPMVVQFAQSARQKPDPEEGKRKC
uniref:RNA-binding region-containing protein 3 n=1 Tax=Gorilla gorilla gorilla TaxID=9595 RepID=A0A2I2ZX50_GORGO